LISFVPSWLDFAGFGQIWFWLGVKPGLPRRHEA
jgi:hypothetical protein